MDWRIAKPVSARADYAAIEGLLTRLSSTFMQKIVAPEATNLRHVRSRSAGDDRRGHGRRPDGDADDRTRATKARASRRIPDGPRSSRSKRRSSRSWPRTRPTTAARTCSTRGRSRRTASRSAAARRCSRSTRAARRERNVEERRGSDGRPTKVEDLLSKLSNLRAVTFENAVPASLKMPNLDRHDPLRHLEEGDGDLRRLRRRCRCRARRRAGSAKIDSMPYDEAIKALDALK